MNDEANGYPEVVMPEVTPKCLLEGQKALVTGADSGIGKGVAIALGAEGADVVVNWVSGQEAADGVVKEIRAHHVEAYAAQRELLPRHLPLWNTEAELETALREYRNRTFIKKQCAGGLSDESIDRLLFYLWTCSQNGSGNCRRRQAGRWRRSRPAARARNPAARRP